MSREKSAEEAYSCERLDISLMTCSSLLWVPADRQPLIGCAIVRFLLAELSFVVIGRGGDRAEGFIAQLQIDAEPDAAVWHGPAELGHVKRVLQNVFKVQFTSCDSDQKRVRRAPQTKWKTGRADDALFRIQDFPRSDVGIAQRFVSGFLGEAYSFGVCLVHFHDSVEHVFWE